MILNLLKNIENCEIIIIILFYILSLDIKNKDDKNLVNEFSKEDKNYDIIKTLQCHKNILQKFNNNNKVKLRNKYLLDLLNNFDYFYVFKSIRFPLVYFLKKNNQNTIYFNGVTFNDKNIIQIFIQIILKKFNQNYINELFEEKGSFYILEKNNIEKTDQFTLLEAFDFMNNKYYSVDSVCNQDKELNIIGYSLGGIISQTFSLIINQKYPKINIKLNNIETWFMNNNKEEFEKFIEKIKNFNNIYNEHSPFKVLIPYIQPFFKPNFIIKNKDIINKLINHLILPSPLKIMDFILNNHSLNNIIK
jgi:hypothetical protein